MREKCKIMISDDEKCVNSKISNERQLEGIYLMINTSSICIIY